MQLIILGGRTKKSHRTQTGLRGGRQSAKADQPAKRKRREKKLTARSDHHKTKTTQRDKRTQEKSRETDYEKLERNQKQEEQGGNNIHTRKELEQITTHNGGGGRDISERELQP